MKKRMLSVLVVLFVLFCVMPSCFAEGKTQDGLEVVLTTDKAEYQRHEAITATLKVTNTNEHAVSNVSLENVVIDGYAIVEGSQGTQEFESLQPAESVSLETTFQEKALAVEGKSEDGQKGSEAVKTGIQNNGEKVLIAAALLLLCVALLYYLAKNRKGKRVFSILLGFAIVGSGMMMMSDSPSAAEALSKIEVSTKITVEQKEVELKGVVSYRTSVKEIGDTLTIADILPEDYPTSRDGAWKTGTGNYSYIDDKIIWFCDPDQNGTGCSLSSRVTKSGDNYLNSTSEVTFIMSGDKLEKIEVNVTSTSPHDYNGVYFPPVDPYATIGEIIPDDFPFSDDQWSIPQNAWKAGDNQFCYKTSDKLCFYTYGYGVENFQSLWAIPFNDGVTKSGESYVYSSVAGTVTFIMSEGKLASIEIAGTADFDGVYSPPQN